MTRWCSLFVLGIALCVGVACSDDTETTGTQGTGGAGGSGGSTGGSGGSSAGGGTGGGTGGSTGGTAGSSGDGGSAGALTDAAAGSGGGSAGDAASDAPLGDSATNWPDVLFQGVWYAGWGGGLDHYSWMRFTQSSPGQPNGQWAALDSSCGSCTGYFPCEGNDGLFVASKGAPTETLTLQYPQSCSGATGEDWSILGFDPAPTFPGALLQMNIQVGTGAGQQIQAFLYPSSQCNAGFTSCTNPF